MRGEGNTPETVVFSSLLMVFFCVGMFAIVQLLSIHFCPFSKFDLISVKFQFNSWPWSFRIKRSLVEIGKFLSEVRLRVRLEYLLESSFLFCFFVCID